MVPFSRFIPSMYSGDPNLLARAAALMATMQAMKSAIVSAEMLVWVEAATAAVPPPPKMPVYAPLVASLVPSALVAA